MRPRNPLYPAVVLLLLAALASAQTPERVPSPDEMERANRAAALLLNERMRAKRPHDHRLLVRCPPTNIAVVSGKYDHVEWVLSRVGVPYITIKPADVQRTNLSGVRLLLLDCPADLNSAALASVRRYVERGGHLLTTDWAAQRVLEKICPGMVRYNRRPTKDDVVPIRVLKPDHAYFRGALRPGRRPIWWLENKSYPIRVLDRRRVTVLVDSPEMGRRYGEPAIIVTFPWRRGRVIHVVSHVYLQRCTKPDAWSKRPSIAFAGDLGFAPDSVAVRRLRAGGYDKSVRTGELYAAYSIQQFLVNVVIGALEVVPVRPRPRPRPPPRTVRSGPVTQVKADTTLRDGPDGRRILAVAAGLRLNVLGEKGGWVCVRTPAGQEGWLRAGEVTGR
jgi:hypothetical protein